MLNAKSITGRAVVIGAGTMGQGISAQLANAGWQVSLLDVVGSNDASPNSPAQSGLDRLTKARPPLLFLPEYSSRIVTGNIRDDMGAVRDADWVVEAIVEQMEAKQQLLANIEKLVGPGTVVTSNTSGLSLSEMARGCSPDFRSRFLGSHFLNPPRYLKLLELVPTAETDPAVLAGFQGFAELVMGHRTVIARDTPGFISTRIWIQHLMESIRIAVEHGLTVEEADFLTGPFIGRPRSGTFRMADIVGLDVVATIAANQLAALPNDPFASKMIPSFPLATLIAAGSLGDKSGRGFYRKETIEILALDLQTGEYRSRIEPSFPDLQAAAKASLADRLELALSDKKSRAGAYLKALFDSLFNYVEYAAPLAAGSADDVDSVMRWGFQWEAGPFEMQQMVAASSDKPSARNHHSSGETPFSTLANYREDHGEVLNSSAGTLVDMGNGVACLEMRTKMHTFGPDVCDFVDLARETAENQFRALVIGSDAPYFSAGFNLKLFLEAAPKEDWAAIDAMLNQVQATFMRLKYSSIPSVAAVRGYTLGGGCECAFACSAIQAAPELVMGLPELPAGLIPAGGAFKELLYRTFEGWDGISDPYPRADRAADYMVALKPTGSAAEARKIGLLRAGDSISKNGDCLLYDAKQKAIGLADAGYSPPAKRGVWAVGANGLSRMRMAILQHSAAYKRISEHDRLIAENVAYVICGGPLSAPQEVSEQYMLNLERGVFLTLVRLPKTLERIEYLLRTGKPLAN